ncbi:MAG: peptidoglycan hydrolase-like protein with peptidoglycan-binding domain [Bradymonadia bacterium]|jgi:peptidoglycan hydrolase-like protein with peptidoglycan-binding domain
MFDLEAMLKEGASKFLKDGAKGEAVEKLQQVLKGGGFDPGAADGIFGAKTKAALQAMQDKAGVSSDGVFGPNSKDAMIKMLGDKGKEMLSDKLGGALGGALGGMFGKK